ncbi:MAG: DUF3732 domain-containing protein [Terriglobales bacterium]
MLRLSFREKTGTLGNDPFCRILKIDKFDAVLPFINCAHNSDYCEGFRISRKSKLDFQPLKVAMLEQELDPDAARERLDTFLNIIGRYMTEYSDRLELEHRGSQLRLDPRNLRVIADTLNGPVPLFRMGSGENWVGYHVLAH